MLLCKGQAALHAEVGIVFQCLFYLMRVSFQIIRFGIEHRQAHPATDIHPYGIGDDGIVRGEVHRRWADRIRHVHRASVLRLR